MDAFLDYSMTVSKAVLILLSVCILIRCIRSMLSERYESEVWAYIRLGREMLPIIDALAEFGNYYQSVVQHE